MITVPTNGDVTEVMADASMAGDITSEILDLEHAKNASIQAIWSGNDAFDAQLELEVSNETLSSSFGPYPDNDSRHILISGETSLTWVLISELLTTRYIRIKYTAVSVTTGLIRFNVTAKGKERY